MSIGYAIKQLRKQLGMKQAELAARVGTDNGNISRLENDKQRASSDMLEKLAEALGVRLSDLYLAAEGSPQQLVSPDDKYVLIPRLNLQVAAGNGTEPEHVVVQDTLAFRREWLAKKGLNPEHLEVYEATGDSMAPGIESGDVLLVDTSAEIGRAHV